MRHGRKPRSRRPEGVRGIPWTEEPVEPAVETTDPSGGDATGMTRVVDDGSELGRGPGAEPGPEPEAPPPDSQAAGPEPETPPPDSQAAGPEPEAPPPDVPPSERLTDAPTLPPPAGAAAAASEGSVSWDDDTAIRLRLASVYLRTGSLAAARVELESLAGRNLLEGRGLLDLAEIRWRTGDRARAGEAAGAYLDAGGDDGLGFVIVAEAAAEAGRHDEARGHLAEAAARLESVARAYLGMRSLVEPERTPRPTPAEPFEPPIEPAVTDASEAAPQLGGPAAAPPPGAESSQTGDVPPSLEADAAMTPVPEPGSPLEAPPAPEPAASPSDPDLAAAVSLLDAGDALRAAVHLGIALRVGSASAQAVIDVIGSSGEPALMLVRGDALRLLGRDEEAALAYRAAASAVADGGGNGAGGDAPRA